MSKYKKLYDRTVHRLREIERIINHRYGVLPDTDDVDVFLNQVACCQLQMRRKKLGQLPEFDDLVGRLSLWCERWAPQASIFQCRDAVREALRRRRIDRADECAARLRLSYEERTRLHITTIGSFDVNKRKRAELRRERKRIRDRDRQARERAERGALPRAEYLARSLARTQPWKRYGIHRRTWERRRRRRQHDRAGRHWPRAGRAAAPKLRRPSTTAKERGSRAKKPAQTPLTNDASQSPSIESVLVGDAPAPIAIDMRTNEEGSWQDPEEKYGVGYLLVKGLSKEIAGHAQAVSFDAVKCICKEQAIALKQVLGDRDHDA